MPGKFRAWLNTFCNTSYGRRPPLILVNGLAEQAETWFRNQRFWSRLFDVHAPNILAYEGAHPSPDRRRFAHRRGLPGRTVAHLPR